MALAAVAQITGFVIFSERLVLSTLRIAFLVAGVILLLQINRIMMSLLLEHPHISNLVFLRRFGQELGQRLTTLVNIAVCGIAFFFFLSIIGAYSSPGKAFEVLLFSQMTIGRLSLSPALILLAALVLYLSSFTSWITRAILESQVFPRMQVARGAGQSVTKLLHYFLILLGLIISLSMIGIDLKSFAVMGGALGIGIGFGLQNIVNDFISGLILLFERPVRAGDRIEANGQIGIVKNIGLRATVIETLDQSQLIVPNSQLVSEKVTNWTHSGTVARLKISVGVAYGSDMDLVIDTLTAAALSSPRVLKKPKPIALLLGFGEFCLNMELHVWLTDVNQTRYAQSEISREILRRFAESGITIPFPQQEIRFRYDENSQPISVLPEAT
jgi:small-conductance mechanosensitive channel